VDAEGIAYWSRPEHHAWDGVWLNHPLARAHANQRVTGRPDLWPIASLRATLPDRLPLRRTASIGCGVGNLERSLVELDFVQTVIGVDYSQNALDVASERATAAGFGDQVSYRCAEARDFLTEEREFDAIFFHSSLHHFTGLDALLGQVREALRPDGILYLDEYVGPSRNEWSWRDLLRWNRIYWTLPLPARRTRVIRAPINRDDPSEAIESSGILSAVEAHFEIALRRDYGGNILAPIYPSLRRPDQPGGPTETAFDDVVRRLMALDDVASASGNSFHTVIIARPRSH
jgi:SAM-dependent methyltransferase